ncbi:hypothetical protein [Antiquaquibacter soli]|uniref:DUF4175 domain-containing protein n=1 Tax=Antiquaquibacter soli TaxID=3064523 RepID=A0ABT9BIR9_9MICO|nr:hypothetical protein [Protaetiibacter sp. WY-16]MDO7880918.1 hypothetical protein [Protaetiibacter sp. WY-16]
MSTTRLTPRGGTIFWGAVLLLIAIVAGMTALLGSWSWTSAVWLVIAFGGLMVLAAVVGAIARALTPAQRDAD